MLYMMQQLRSLKQVTSTWRDSDMTTACGSNFNSAHFGSNFNSYRWIQLPTAAMNSNASTPTSDEHVPAPTTPPRVIEDADGGFWHYRRGVWWWTMESRPQKRKQAYACTGSKQERKKWHRWLLNKPLVVARNRVTLFVHRLLQTCAQVRKLKKGSSAHTAHTSHTTHNTHNIHQTHKNNIYHMFIKNLGPKAMSTRMSTQHLPHKTHSTIFCHVFKNLSPKPHPSPQHTHTSHTHTQTLNPKP